MKGGVIGGAYYTKVDKILKDLGSNKQKYLSRITCN